ncbi:cell division topological specificity factor MinE [Deinococcus sonorensis]|uniref:Cell division topological specificity factor n=2 Tax=Deinococcus sonorensis TaxID=309891 RepID=A0AAU7U822_9DEIO
MFSFLKGRRSKDELKNRLELVLAYDRAQIPPGKVDALRKDLLEVVNRYFPTQGSNVEVEQRGDTVVLVANIPLGGRDK